VDAKPPDDDAVVTALCEALAPYYWRRFTPDLLARFALAVRDRQELTALLSALQGAAVGGWERLEPAERSDVRILRIVRFLADLRWAESSLLATCGMLAGALGPDLG
jgi:hypothetical protein